MIVVVGGRDSQFRFMDHNKVKFFHENDPDNFFYNEMCGHKFLLDNLGKYGGDSYIGLEHYRRAFDYSDREINDILKGYEIIVKEEHGPFGECSNLDVLSWCSRHGDDFTKMAREWVDRFPELKEQAERRTHYGCNMFITTPKKYRAMMEDEFAYIREFLKYPGLPRASIGYFCETILTPHIIKKHNRSIFVGSVSVG